MSQHNTRCTKGAEIDNPGAFARHAQACEECADAREAEQAAEENAENGGYRASDVELEEIPLAVERADAATLDATLAKHAHEPADGDTRETAAAKALILAKSGGKAAYRTVFGTCGVPDCDFGANGFRATTCKRHADEQATRESAEVRDPEESGDSSPETAENDVCDNPYADAEPEREPADVGTDALPPRAKIVAELVNSRGLEPHTAENAASYVYELVDAGLSPREAGSAAAERFQ